MHEQRHQLDHHHSEFPEKLNGALQPVAPAIVHALLSLFALGLWMLAVASMAAAHSLGRIALYYAFAYPIIGVVVVILVPTAAFCYKHRKIASTWVMEKDGWLIIGIGVVVRRWNHLRVDDIHHVETFRNPIDRAFETTSIKLHTRGAAHSQIVLKGVPQQLGEQFKDWLNEHQSSVQNATQTDNDPEPA